MNFLTGDDIPEPIGQTAWQRRFAEMETENRDLRAKLALCEKEKRHQASAIVEKEGHAAIANGLIFKAKRLFRLADALRKNET